MSSMIDFKQYGAVVSGSEKPPILHAYMQTPFIPFCQWDNYLSQKEVDISMNVNAFSDYELLKKIINSTLCEIEGLNISYDATFCRWLIEYGTKPLEETVPRDQLLRVNLGRVVAILAATKAYEKFPHNLDNYDNYDDYMHGDEFKNLYTINKWCKMEFSVIYDLFVGALIIQPTRIKGDHSSFYFVALKVKEAINNNKNKLWLMRKSYVELFEGVQFGNDRQDHTTKYLLNDLICKEVCSFMSL